MWIQFGFSHSHVVFSTWDTCLRGFRFDLITYLRWFHHTFEPPSPTFCDPQNIDVWNKHVPMNHFLFLYPPCNNNTKQAIFMRQGQVLKRLKGEDCGSQCTFVGDWKKNNTFPTIGKGKHKNQRQSIREKQVGAPRGKQRFGLRKRWGFEQFCKDVWFLSDSNVFFSIFYYVYCTLVIEYYMN